MGGPVLRLSQGLLERSLPLPQGPEFPGDLGQKGPDLIGIKAAPGRTKASLGDQIGR
jgi:hypothetical protein